MPRKPRDRASLDDTAPDAETADPAEDGATGGGGGDDLASASHGWARPSRSQLKREAHAVTAFGERLVELRPAELQSLPLDDELREEIETCRGLTKNARLRQLRLIARLLRARDLRAMQEALDGIDGRHRATVQAEKAAEAWRTRLLEAGDAALGELLADHPDADRQLLRQLMRAAGGPAESARTKRARRELLRAVRALPLLDP